MTPEQFTEFTFSFFRRDVEMRRASSGVGANQLNPTGGKQAGDRCSGEAPPRKSCNDIPSPDALGLMGVECGSTDGVRDCKHCGGSLCVGCWKKTPCLFADQHEVEA
jgi:hypothetical protein